MLPQKLRERVYVMRAFVVTVAGIFCWLCAAFAERNPPIEAYGELASLSHVAISPDGERLAFILRDDEADVLGVLNLETKETFSIGIGDAKADSVSWFDSEHVIFRAFDNTRVFGYRGKFRFSAAISINVTKGSYRWLLRQTEGLHPAQSGLGHIVGKLDETNQILMPAYMGQNENAGYSLLRVDPDTGRGRLMERGLSDTIDWFVSRDGTIIAQENYDNQTNRYWIRTQANENGRWETVFESNREQGPLGLVGVSPDQSSLLFFLDDDDGYSKLFGMSLSGEPLGKVLGKEGVEIVGALRNLDRTILALSMEVCDRRMSSSTAL